MTHIGWDHESRRDRGRDSLDLPPVPQAWRSCARHHVPLLPFGPDGVGGL